MSRAAQRRAGRPVFELLEDATHLLRTAPAGALLCYYLGSVPCLLGLLFFWADMSRGAFAREHLLEASLSAAALYLWMKCWHAVFAAKLRAHLTLQPEAPWTFVRIAHLALVQTALQPAGLFLRPIAALMALPYVWTYGLFQSAGVLGDGTRADLGGLVRDSAQQARLHLGQAHGALVALFAFAFFVWLNICIAFALAPQMLKTFLGIETVFTRDAWTMVNTTTFAATLAATYLCIDPLRKAVFVLRCFHGASLRSGEDLRAGLKALRPAAALAVAFLALPLAPLRAADPPPPRVESAELNRSLDRVLQQREYAWRLPREAAAPADAQKGWFATFFEELWKKFVGTVKAVLRWCDSVIDWLRKLFQTDRPPRDRSDRSVNWSGMARGTLLALLVVLAVLLGVLLWRWRKAHRAALAHAEPVAAVPDLNEEHVTADQLPEDGWLRLARELMERGELRLALRAHYLAGLAHLGQRELIHLARHKSNREYDRELRRRARGNASLLTAFEANLLTFESAWYGEHAVTAETLGGFSQHLEIIRTC